MGLFMIFTIIPAITNLISIVPMLFYNLSGKKMALIEARLAHKRKAEYDAKMAEQAALEGVTEVTAVVEEDVTVQISETEEKGE